MPNSKQIVYLSQSQYAELIANGTITVDGVTVTYNENDIYVTPQAEPVTDVRVAGTSIAANGVADIPMATATTAGAIIVGDGLQKGSTKLLTNPATATQIKAGIKPYEPIVPSTQHISTFYGLAKVAGHDEKDSAESVGTYTPEAKGAIQQMLGVSDLIATAENTLVASKAYAIGDVFTVNGKLYKATVAIAANDSIVLQNSGETVSGANAVETNVGEGFVKFTNAATINKAGVVKVNSSYGLCMGSGGDIRIYSAPSSDIKRANSSQRAISPDKQHEAVFYGLTKAAGVDMASSDNAVGTYTDDAKAAIRTMLGTVGTTDYATASDYGIVKLGGGLTKDGNGFTVTDYANSSVIKTGAGNRRPITPAFQHESVFYGLAAAAGDTTQKTAATYVGTYTDNAKASIKSMLGIQDGSTGTVDVSGTTPTITAVENTRYVCGEVTSLDFTPAASGICIVRFTSGSTVTVLTLPSTVKFPEWFDATALETNTIYEICVTDGVYGAVMSWAL